MNDCNSYLENLSAYLDGELSQADKQSFEEHIHSCEACSGELALMNAIISSCNELEEELPEGFEASLHKRLEAAKEEAADKKKQLVRIRTYSQIAAGFVLVIALGLFIRSGLFMQKAGNSTQPQNAPMTAAGNASSQDAMKESEDNDDGLVDTAENLQTQRALTTSMKTAPPPNATPTLMAKHDDLETAEKVVIEPDAGIYAMMFTEATTNRVEGNDTLIRIEVSDIPKALDSIMAIEKKLEAGGASNYEVLSKSKQEYGGADQPVDLKLYYSNDVLWQQFLSEMQGAFPEMVVESVTAQEEQEYIRVVLVNIE